MIKGENFISENLTVGIGALLFISITVIVTGA